MAQDYQPALSKTTPSVMRQIRVASRGTTDSAIAVGRVAFITVTADAVCWLKVDESTDAHSFTKAASADKSSDNSLEIKHPGGGASLTIIQETEFEQLHAVADSGTVNLEIYTGAESV